MGQTLHRLPFAAFGLPLAALFCGGCGEQHDRVPVAGEVTKAGTPLKEGSVSFLPLGGDARPAATTEVSAGRYAFDRETGPTPGPHRVVVVEMFAEKPAPASADSASGFVAESSEPRDQWEFEIEVPAAAPATQDFSLD